MEDLQGLLEKINRDGVEKADAEARRIIAEATAKADEIVRAANAKAAAAKAESEKAAADYAARAAETIRQSARDVVIGVRDSLTALLERLLAEDVNKTLADEKTATSLVLEAVKGLTGPGEITCGAKLASALKAQLASGGGFTVSAEDSTGCGFTVKFDNGRVEHSFTEGVIAEELAKRLRPDLAKLLT